MRIQPDGAGFGFAKLGAVGLFHQRHGETVYLAAVQAPGQVNTAGDVAPLVRAANLQPTAMLSVQLRKVIRLQDHVGEFGKADTRTFPVDSLLDRFFLDHVIDGEMLADVPEEGQDIETRCPVEIIDNRCRRIALKIDEPTHLGTKLLHPTGHHLGGIEVTLAGFKAGIANQPGSTTHQRQGPVTRQLKATQH